MLLELTIRNFAIIDDLNIRFSDGLTILSGETGAGKSIILNAVNLLLGSRASSQLIRTGADSAELEAMFEVSEKSPTANLLEEQGYDPTAGLVIRRIISIDNRHRIYINGRMATLQVLQSLTENLASISGQHAHQGLLKEEQHLLFLDRYGDLMPPREEVGRLYQQVQPLIRRIANLEALKRRQAEQIALYAFQKQEILDAEILPGEDESLEAERLRLKHSEALLTAANAAVGILYSEGGSVSERLTDLRNKLEQAAKIDNALALQAEAATEMLFKVEDMARDLEHYASGMDLDNGRLEVVEERLDRLGRLKKKYGGAIEAVLQHLSAIEAAMSEVENLSETMAEAEKDLSFIRTQLGQASTELSAKRHAAALRMAEQVEAELATLKMSRTRFSVDLSPLPPDANTPEALIWEGMTLGETGLDRASFMIAPNVGEALKPLAAIASGGELSRVVLALKAILARGGAVETVVFDEVDAGIGGATAETVGKKMVDLARHHQVLCITHLSQIAKFGNHHFRIEKEVIKDRTHTRITPLTMEGRVHEIARMLGGDVMTQKTLEHAREILGLEK
jgi:DNA repair protein RecN (Recombination protein N)